ncbi:MAG: hypothetical protein CML56_10325 [Rhodobacteraceae bacterium]|nr:hypothetical protein [Paracoccaceae bacterium]
MKWVLFIIFSGTTVIPLAEYTDEDKCVDASNELKIIADEAQQSGASAAYQYQCLPAPKKFLLFK